MKIEEFYEIHDLLTPVGHKGMAFLMLTPYMLDQPMASQLFKGEYSGWSMVVRGRMPQEFPLKAVTTLPPDSEQFLFADRARWKDEQLAEPELETDPKPKKKEAPAE
jgi:hypothetical protein